MCLFEILGGFTRCKVRNKTAAKMAENGDFQIIVSLLNVHYPIFFILLFKYYAQALCGVKI